MHHVRALLVTLASACLPAGVWSTPVSHQRVELHVHLDGAIPPATLLRIAQRRQLRLPVVGIPRTVADVWTSLRSITPVWHWFDLVNNVIGGDVATLHEVAAEFVGQQAAAGVAYTEVRYDPVRVAYSNYSLTRITQEAAVAAIRAGLADGSQRHGVEVHQLLCAMRGQPAKACFDLVALAAKMRSGTVGGVVGIDLAGDEFHFNNSQGDVEACFAHAKGTLQLNTTVHAGEMAGPSDVATALGAMEADRIGHGYSATRDAALMAKLRARGTHLEACPGNHIQNLADVGAFQRQGLRFGLNTDDPAAYFGNVSLPKTEDIVRTQLGFTAQMVAKAYADARAAAFAPHAAAVVAAEAAAVTATEEAATENAAIAEDVKTAEYQVEAAEAAAAATMGYRIEYFEQRTDHFSFGAAAEASWKQRYLINDEHWVPGGPILFYTGNEGPITAFYGACGFMTDVLAPRLGALLLFAEMRFYGTSMPFGPSASHSADALRLLSTEQVLADYAALLRALKPTFNATGAPVVSFGGSYGGTLATLFRLKYPHVTVGALAASAPLGYYSPTFWPQRGVDEFTWFRTVVRVYSEARPRCYDALVRAVSSTHGAHARTSKCASPCPSCAPMFNSCAHTHPMCRRLASHVRLRPPRTHRCLRASRQPFNSAPPPRTLLPSRTGSQRHSSRSLRWTIQRSSAASPPRLSTPPVQQYAPN